MHEELDTLQAENRRDHVWSTEAFTALTEPGTLWADKKGLLPPKDFSEIQEQLDIGKGIQGFWMRFWADRNGVSFKDADYTMYHPKVAMASHFDYIAEDGKTLYEIKNLGHHQRKHYGEDGTDHVHPRYRAQCLHEAACHGLQDVVLVAAFGGQTVQHFPLHFSADEIDAHVHAIAKFWASVVEDVKPENLPEEAIRKMFPVSRPATITTTQSVLTAVKTLSVIKEQIKTLEEQESSLRNAIVSYMGANDTLADLDGSVLATFKSAKPSKKFTMDRFKTEYPQIYELFLEEMPGSRRFLIK